MQLNQLKDKYQYYKLKYEKHIPASFFILGFLIDVITLDRIDHWASITTQSVYLLIAIFILSFSLKDPSGEVLPHRFFKKIWPYKQEALHFIFGSLLSSYTLFYFKSASIETSILFMFILSSFLILNETKRFKDKEVRFKFALLVLCLVSYFSYIVPILLGSIGYFSFFLGIFITSLSVSIIYFILIKENIERITVIKNLISPAVGVIGLFVVLFFLKAIPPVPLSLQHIGIYHKVEREGEKYKLSYVRPFWLFWNNSSNMFKAAPEDKIYCFIRLFSPANFSDKINYHWLYKHPKWGWQTMDKVAITISGGRDEGFRGYAYKSKYTPGDWRVQVETADGREIGRLSFSIESLTDGVKQDEYRFKYY